MINKNVANQGSIVKIEIYSSYICFLAIHKSVSSN